METAQDLMFIISEQIQKMKKGDGNPKFANSIANCATKMTYMASAMMRYKKETGETPNVEFFETKKMISASSSPNEAIESFLKLCDKDTLQKAINDKTTPAKS